MLPTLPESCRVVVRAVPLHEVQVGRFDGDVILTRLRGLNIVHRAVERRPDGSIVTWGDNNAAPDSVPTMPRNFIGTVLGYEVPGQPGELTKPGAHILIESWAKAGRWSRDAFVPDAGPNATMASHSHE